MHAYIPNYIFIASTNFGSVIGCLHNNSLGKGFIIEFINCIRN